MAKELLTAHKIRSITNAGIYRDGGGLRLIVTARARSAESCGSQSMARGEC